MPHSQHNREGQPQGAGNYEALNPPALHAMEDKVNDYQITLSESGKVARIVNARCADDHEACALAQRMLDVKGQANVWASSRHVGWVSAVSFAGIKAISQPWAIRPLD